MLSSAFGGVYRRDKGEKGSKSLFFSFSSSFSIQFPHGPPIPRAETQRFVEKVFCKVLMTFTLKTDYRLLITDYNVIRKVGMGV